MAIKIGLEVHIPLKTTTKLFCGCPTTPSSAPNTQTCPTCIGLPGAKPVLNKKAVELALKIGLALQCDIAERFRFSRKTYFYPDLAKNYQITQYEVPLGANGKLGLSNGKTVAISRIHLEEDPGSLEHKENYCLIDYNRSGIPLVELVTAPILDSPEEARDFMKQLVNVLSYLNVYDENIGHLKADANVSIAEKNYTRVEVKNITGFKEIERALTYEIDRQKRHDVVRETRGWDAVKGVTVSLRSKEYEEDYGYILDPDLPTISLERQFIIETGKTIPELPRQKAERWVRAHKIDPVDAAVIATDRDLAGVYEHIVTKVDPVIAARWFRKDVIRALEGKPAARLNPASVRELLELVQRHKITDAVAREILDLLVKKDFSPKEHVTKQGLGAISDETHLQKLVEEAVASNPQAVADYRAGELKALNAIVGHVMKQTKGKATPDAVKRLVEEALAS